MHLQNASPHAFKNAPSSGWNLRRQRAFQQAAKRGFTVGENTPSSLIIIPDADLVLQLILL